MACPYNAIQTDLFTQLENLYQQYPRCFTKQIIVLTDVDESVEGQLEERLQQEKQDLTGKCVTLIPYRLKNSHWNAILIKFQPDNRVKWAKYITPINGPNTIPRHLEKQFMKVYPNVALEAKNLGKQDTQTARAALTIEDLLTTAKIELPTATARPKNLKSIVTCVKRSPTRGNEMNVFKPRQIISDPPIDESNVDELREKLNIGLGKCNIQDVNSLSEEIRDTDERIQKLQRQGRKEKAKEEMEFLQQLQKLQELSDKISELTINTLVALPDHESELHELNGKLISGLAKIGLQKSGELSREIKDTEERIQQLQRQGRKEKAEEEMEFLRQLQELQELSDKISEMTISTPVPLLDHESELRELNEKLISGLAKISLQNVDELSVEIKHTEERILKLQRQKREDKAQEEREFLCELQELKKISHKVAELTSDATDPSFDPKFIRRELHDTSDTHLVQDNLNNTTEPIPTIVPPEPHMDEPVIQELSSEQPSDPDIVSRNEREKKLLYITELRNEADAMTTCARKTIIELLVKFEQKLLEESTSSENEDVMILPLQKLQDQMKKEELLSEDTKAILRNMDLYKTSENYSVIVRYLNGLLKKIRTLNMPEIQRLVLKAKEAAELIRGKDVILCIGATGAGKSTTIQFLAGATMRKVRVKIDSEIFVEHITAVEPHRNPELNNVISSPRMKSETRYIAPVTVQLKDIFGVQETGVITLCDAPGFGDTAGPEVDIANSIGVIEALKETKSVKLLVLSSYVNLGDRGEGIQRLARILINTVNGIEERLDSIFYAFTKYPKEIDINALLLNIKTSKVNTDISLQSDTAFMTILSDMIKKNKNGAHKIDPIHDDPKILIEQLKRVEEIFFPANVFQFPMNEETRASIADHVQRDEFSIICAMKHKDIDLVLYYLNDLKILEDLIKQSDIRKAYEDSKRFISENIDQYCTEVKKSFNRALTSGDGLGENDVHDYKDSVKYLQQMQILKEHLGSSLLSPEVLLQNITIQLHERNRILENEDLHNSLVGIYLDNLHILKNSFKEFEPKYRGSCKEFEKRFEVLVHLVHEAIPTNDFEQIAKLILDISKSAQTLRKHLSEHIDEKYIDIVTSFLRHLSHFSDQADPILAKVKLSNDDVEILKKHMEILRTAKENSLLQDRISTYIDVLRKRTDDSKQQNTNRVSPDTFTDVNEIYNKFIDKFIKYFDEINVRIKEIFERNKDHALEDIQKLVNEMELLRTIPELESKTAGTYYRIVGNIRGYTQELQAEAEKLLTDIDRHSGITNHKHLARFLLRLKNAEWINRVNPGTHDTLMRRITEELVLHASQLEDRLMKIDLSLKYPDHVCKAYEIVEQIESMRDLERSFPELEKHRNKILQHFLQCIKVVFNRIQEIFNLQEKKVYPMKQKVKELEDIQIEYENLHPARISLQNQEYPHISIWTGEIDKLTAKQKVESQVAEGKQYDMNVDAVNHATEKSSNMNDLMTSEHSSSDLQHLESVKKEKDLLLITHNSSSSEQMSFLQEKGFSSYELLIETIQKEKREQSYYFNEKLDASTANDALVYINKCEKIGDSHVREMVTEMSESMKKYIYEYGQFLNQEIRKKFNCIRKINPEESPSRYSHDLEIRLQELSSLSKYSYLFECIEGSEKKEYWNREFFVYYCDLDHKIKDYKINGKIKELRDQLTVAQALFCVDRFYENVRFAALYREYQEELTKDCKVAYRIVLDCISKGDYANADMALSDIDENPSNLRDLVQIRYDLQISLIKLITDTRSILNWLDEKNQREDNRSQISQIKENIDKIRLALNKYRITDLLDDETRSLLQNFLNGIDENLSDIIQKRLYSIEVFLDINSFSEAEQGMEHLSQVQRELASYCTSYSVLKKYEELKERLDNIRNEILERKDFENIDKYAMNPPKDILAKIHIAASRGSAKYAQLYNEMSTNFKQHFSHAVDEVRTMPLEERPTKLSSLSKALFFLPDEMQPLFRGQIDEVTKLIHSEEQAYRLHLDRALRIDDNEENAIAIIGSIAKEFKTGNMHEFFGKLHDQIRVRLCDYRTNVEYSLDNQDMQTAVSIVKKIFRYKESLDRLIPEIEESYRSVLDLINKSFLNCCKTVANISSIEHVHLVENAFNNIIIYFNFSTTFMEEVLTENMLQNAREGFQKMSEYLYENSKTFQHVLEEMNIVELYKVILISKKWDGLLQKIKVCPLKHNLVQNLLKQTKDIIPYIDEMSELEKVVNGLKKQLDVELINDYTTKFEVKRDEFFSILERALSTLKTINSKFKDILPFTLNINKLEEDLQKKITGMNIRLIAKASKEEFATRDSNDFRMYYNHLESFQKYIHLAELNIKQTLEESKEKILEKIAALHQEVVGVKSDVTSVSNALCKMKFFAVNLSMFENDVNSEIDESLKIYKVKQGIQGIMKLTIALEKIEDGLRVISEHACLSGEDWRRRREKMQKQDDVDYILAGLTGDDVAKDSLRARFETFRKKYHDLLKSNLKSINQSAEIEPDLGLLITETKMLVGKMTNKSKNIPWGHPLKDRIPELLAYIFAVWTLRNTQHYNAMRGIDNAKAYLLMPHAGQVIAIFRLLGLGYDNRKEILGRKIPLTGIMVDDLVNNLVEVGTGEGKSVVMAITACVFALIGKDVNCSCYSEVLSTRDKNDFASVFKAFGIEDRIEYGTFNKLCEQLLNEQCNVREKVRDMIMTNKSSLAVANTSARIRLKVLLIDEVDVFLSDKFYGGIYIPCVFLKDPSIKALLDSIWQNRTLRSLNSVKALPACQACASKYSHWIFLFNEAIKDMLAALQSYQSSTYIVQNDKIVYVEGESIADNVVRGYDTVWAYYHENEKGNISSTSLNDNVGIIVNCGTFSYAEMPHDFSYIGGVTGTLRTLSKVEKRILERVYAINKTTFMPSVFGSSNHTYNSMNDVRVVKESEYFMEISGEIDVVCNANRAILVFFESEEKLMTFYNSSELFSIKKDVQIIMEKVSVKDRELCIKRAAMMGKVTLLTRTFGRGTDFICRNQQLLANGGVHVLQTFFSEELSEEYQIMGRGARQGDKGSYRMILLDKDLEWAIGASWKEELPKIVGTTLYEVLNKYRSVLYESKCGSKELSIEQCKTEHKASKEFMNALTLGNMEMIKEFLIKQNQGANLATASSRTVLLMDATGSMASLLSATKETVCTMFERASTVLSEKGLPNDAFQMQFAIYRNYNSAENKILQVSTWNTKASNLRAFMNTIGPEGGAGNEAIEIGLWHAVRENEMPDSISQVILIGDAPANSQNEVTQKRAHFGENYWKGTRFAQPTYYATELKKLKDKNIPIHTFYLTPRAKTNFEEIARETSGRCEALNIRSAQGAESLTHFVTEEVLRKTAGDQGNAAVELYRAKYVKSFTS